MNDKYALVVIPTTGSPTLENAIASVLLQDHPKTDLWVVVDGPEHAAKTDSILARFKDHQIKTLRLPANTGADGFYGHRIYAAVSYLFNHDYVLYLDQDNWFESAHVSSTITACETNGWDWCHSLRKIFSAEGRYVCDDDCESLGRYAIYLSDHHHLVDTSTYCIKREVMLNMAPAWYGGWGGDRRFFSAMLKHVPNFGCTGRSTVAYRLDGNPQSVTADFFIQGNEVMRQRYPGGFPWRT